MHGDALADVIGPFEVTLTSLPGARCATVRGEVDLATSRRLEQAVAAAADGAVDGEEIVLDLAAVSYIDSTGLRVLMRLRRRLGDRLALGPVSPPVRDVIRLAGLADVLPTHR
ncbi:MAG TPA: anti-sigma factor antagonist [Miltoncostaeaceae bacterium]|nr:anti-sigma factor antagonist [Miltoncostaeaceae bacterium]